MLALGLGSNVCTCATFSLFFSLCTFAQTSALFYLDFLDSRRRQSRKEKKEIKRAKEESYRLPFQSFYQLSLRLLFQRALRASWLAKFKGERLRPSTRTTNTAQVLSFLLLRPQGPTAFGDTQLLVWLVCQRLVISSLVTLSVLGPSVLGPSPSLTIRRKHNNNNNFQVIKGAQYLCKNS